VSADINYGELTRRLTDAAEKMMKSGGKTTLPFDPFALAQASGEVAMSMAMRPQDLLQVQMDAAKQWGDFWMGAMSGKAAGEAPRDRRFMSAEWQDEPYYRGVRDAYLLASQQLRELVSLGDGDDGSKATVRFLLDQYLNAVSPANFAFTNPDVVKRIQETNGANLVQGFAHLIEDVAGGKGIVQRRSDPNAFVKGETIAATPGQVVFQNDLFQLIQYTPTTEKVAVEPLLYVPPLVNRYYMIDLVPKQSFVKWLVDEGRTVFVISWVNPGVEHKNKAVADYVSEGIVTAIEQVNKRTGQAPDLFSFCLGGTLVAIALAYLAANKRAEDVNSATLIGSLVDFSDMRDWSAFVHEGHLAALEDHLEAQGFIDSVELQRLFAAMRANDLIWSSVVNHYLLDKEAPASDLLYWFEDGARIPAAFLKSYNRELLKDNKLKEPAGFKVGDTAIDLAAITTPMMIIALKDDHVSAWEAVYGGARHLGADFVLGGSGHNAGVINPPARNKHGYWTGGTLVENADDWLAKATKHEGSWWPYWTQWLDKKGSGKNVAGRAIEDGIEPAPGAYAMMS
jgi:polyhydroxyalkanoate synthase